MDELQAIDRDIADLRQRQAAALAVLPQAEAALAEADARLARDQRVYDEAGGQVVATRAAGRLPFGVHRERSSAEADALAADQRAAEALHGMADEALGATLIDRNAAAKRRGELLAESRRCEQLIAQAQMRRDRLAAQAVAARAPLERLRQKVAAALGGG